MKLTAGTDSVQRPDPAVVKPVPGDVGIASVGVLSHSRSSFNDMPIPVPSE